VLVLVFDTNEDLENVDDADEDFDTAELNEPVAEIFAVMDPLDVKLPLAEDVCEPVADPVTEDICEAVFTLDTDGVFDDRGLVVTDPDRVGVKDEVLLTAGVLLLEGLTVLDLDI
jgi:hypothetical protein